jgi:hypothetical protein
MSFRLPSCLDSVAVAAVDLARFDDQRAVDHVHAARKAESTALARSELDR